MTFTTQQIAHAVGIAVRYEAVRERIPLQSARVLVDHIAEQVQATERPSEIAPTGGPMDQGIRREIVARVLTTATLAAEEFGSQSINERVEITRRKAESH